MRPAPDLPSWARKASVYSAPPNPNPNGMHGSLVIFYLCLAKLVGSLTRNCILFLYLKGVFPICSQGSINLTLSVPQFEGPTVGSRSKGDTIVTRLNTLKLSNVEPGQYLDGRPPGSTGCC